MFFRRHLHHHQHQAASTTTTPKVLEVGQVTTARSLERLGACCGVPQRWHHPRCRGRSCARGRSADRRCEPRRCRRSVGRDGSQRGRIRARGRTTPTAILGTLHVPAIRAGCRGRYRLSHRTRCDGRCEALPRSYSQLPRHSHGTPMGVATNPDYSHHSPLYREWMGVGSSGWKVSIHAAATPTM